MRRFAFRAAMVAVVLAGHADAQESRKRVAVLEFTNEAGLKEKEAEQLADDVRGAALLLPRDRYLVMTRESILVLLPPGRSFQECVGGQCEVEAGRLVGADLVVAGTVRRFAGDYIVTLKLFDTHAGPFRGRGSARRRT